MSSEPNLHYMPLWVKDLLADEACTLMPDAEFGCLMRMLARQWVNGSIPTEPDQVNALLGGDQQARSSYLARLLDSHMPKGDDGRRRNARCEEERGKVIARINRNRNNGIKGGRPVGSTKTQNNQSVISGLSQNKPTPSDLGLIRASGLFCSSSPEGSAEGNQVCQPAEPVPYRVAEDMLKARLSRDLGTNEARALAGVIETLEQEPVIVNQKFIPTHRLLQMAVECVPVEARNPISYLSTVIDAARKSNTLPDAKRTAPGSDKHVPAPVKSQTWGGKW